MRSESHIAAGTAPVPGARRDVTAIALASWAATCLAAVLALVSWPMGRGFDLSDEGYYLLGYRHPEDVHLTLNHFQQLVAWAVGTGARPVVQFRIAGLILTLLAAAFFGVQALGFWDRQTGTQSGWRRLSCALVTATGALVYYAFGPRSLSYNSLNNAGLLVGAGLALGLARENGKTRPLLPDLLPALLLGAVLGAHVVVKASSAVLLAGWIGAVALLARSPLRRTTALAAVTGGGAALFGVLFFSRIVPFHVWRSGIEIARPALADYYALRPLLAASLLPFVLEATRFLPVAALAAGAAFAAARLEARGARAPAWILRALSLVALAGGLALLRAFEAGTRHADGSALAHASALAVAVAHWLGSRAPGEGAPRRSRAAFLALLFVLPALGALGSYNPLQRQILFHLAPWFAALFLVVDDARPRGLAPAAAALALLLAVSHVAYGQLVDPYRLPGGLAAQEHALSPRLVAGTGLLVDADTKRLVEGGRAVLERGGFRAGDPLWAFYDLPGLVYLVDARAPELPWLFAYSEALVCEAVTLGLRQPGSPRVFVALRRPFSERMLRCLSEAGAPFPERFEPLGQIETAAFGSVAFLRLAP